MPAVIIVGWSTAAAQPTGPTSGGAPVAHCGSWLGDPSDCRCARRNGLRASRFTQSFVGFVSPGADAVEL